MTPKIEFLQTSEVFAHAERHIRETASELWPAAPILMQEHVPSVTSYVQRIQVGQRSLFAKLSFLGGSLVSVMRGRHGTWQQVRRAQTSYIARYDALVRREARQLRFIDGLGRPQVAGIAGVHRGVLFTGRVTGESMADVLLVHPAETADLLAAGFQELGPLHHPRCLQRFHTFAATAERSIEGTFRRKFQSPPGDGLEFFGTERCSQSNQEKALLFLRAAVAWLRQVRGTVTPTAQRVLVYGDVKPEHIIFAPDGRPIFIDPGVFFAGVPVDVAKLISRTALLMATIRSDGRVFTHIADGIGAFVFSRAETISASTRLEWLREVLRLWLMDSVNIISTYLSAPPGLPLPTTAEKFLAHPVPLCRMLAATSTDLATNQDSAALWERTLTRLGQVGS